MVRVFTFVHGDRLVHFLGFRDFACISTSYKKVEVAGESPLRNVDASLETHGKRCAGYLHALKGEFLRQCNVWDVPGFPCRKLFSSLQEN